MSQESKFFWKNSYTFYIAITAIISITSFLVGHSYRIMANENSIYEIRKSLDEKSNKREFELSIQAIRDDIRELKETHKENNQKLEEIYKLLIKRVP